ncbi:NAD(P)-binding protein [Paxillus ammoniavirescens]|nr:NAD(P)-binding protein [Paxillus ammoniavirescens]
MPTWLITGASRGLGSGLVQELITSADNIVFASCRNPEDAKGLRSLSESSARKGSLFIIQLNVTDEASVFMAQREVESILGSRGLDFLINNAAVNDSPSNMSISDLVSTVETNVGGPALVTRTFIPLLERSTRKVIVNISSTLGSIGMDMGGEHTTYSISKMALNMLTYKQLKERPDLITFAIHPGWCKTDMGGEDATSEVTDGVRRVLRIVKDATPECSGKFFDEEGVIVPW